MSYGRPQYYKNHLQPIEVNRNTLLETLKQLRVAVVRGVDLIQAGSPPTGDWDNGGMFNGVPGIALAFLRLERQAESLGEKGEGSLPNFHTLARQRIPPRGPDLPLQATSLSPVGSSSSLTAAVLRILAATTAAEDARGSISKDDISSLEKAVGLALANPPLINYRGQNIGVDEVLYGRAGLLWAILNLRTRGFDTETRNALLSIFETVPKLIDVIVDAGRQGSRDYIKKYGEKNALPLMWIWMEGRYGLGGVHGMTGILTVLLACRKEELDGGGASRNYFPWIADTITGLCRLCIANKGHLPTSIPDSPSSRPSPLVQICHGSPSLLILLACARGDDHLSFHYWQPEWDEAIRLAAERIWEEGILSKGGSLCHGIAGNAWPFLLLHDCFEYGKEQSERAKRNYKERSGTSDVGLAGTKDALTGDYFLSRALALLLHARETRPYNRSAKTVSNDYRMPDSPYSLFEGLAGTVCAWAEACAAIQTRLRKMELDDEGATPATTPEDDEIFEKLSLRQLGFPGLGGHGPSGLF